MFRIKEYRRRFRRQNFSTFPLPYALRILKAQLRLSYICIRIIKNQRKWRYWTFIDNKGCISYEYLYKLISLLYILTIMLMYSANFYKFLNLPKSLYQISRSKESQKDICLWVRSIEKIIWLSLDVGLLINSIKVIDKI